MAVAFDSKAYDKPMVTTLIQAICQRCNGKGWVLSTPKHNGRSQRIACPRCRLRLE